MAGQRSKPDYKAEYARRQQLAKQRGLSTSQARGHARPYELPVSLVRNVKRSDWLLRDIIGLSNDAKHDPDMREEVGRLIEKYRSIDWKGNRHKQLNEIPGVRELVDDLRDVAELYDEDYAPPGETPK